MKLGVRPFRALEVHSQAFQLPCVPSARCPASWPQQKAFSLSSVPEQHVSHGIPGHSAHLGLPCPAQRPCLPGLCVPFVDTSKAESLESSTGRSFTSCSFAQSPRPSSLPAWMGRSPCSKQGNGRSGSEDAAPPNTHHGDIFHFLLARLGKGGGLFGGLLLGGGSGLLRGQVCVAEVSLQGLKHPQEEAQVILPGGTWALLPWISPPCFLCKPHACASWPPSLPAISSTPTILPAPPLGPAAQPPVHMVYAHIGTCVLLGDGKGGRGRGTVWCPASPRGSLTCSGDVPAAKRQKQSELESPS